MTVISEIAGAPRIEPEEAGHHTGAARYFRDLDGALFRLEPADSHSFEYEHIRVQALAPGDIDPAATIEEGLSTLEYYERCRLNDPRMGPPPMLAQDLGVEPDICPGCQQQIIWRDIWTATSGGRLYHDNCAPRISVDCPRCRGLSYVVVTPARRGWFKTIPAVTRSCGCSCGEIRVIAP